MEYKYEIKEIYEKCLNLMPLGMITKHYYQGVIYVEVEEKILCFKSNERAAQFGKQFAHLYNKIFILNK